MPGSTKAGLYAQRSLRPGDCHRSALLGRVAAGRGTALLVAAMAYLSIISSPAQSGDLQFYLRGDLGLSVPRGSDGQILTQGGAPLFNIAGYDLDTWVVFGGGIGAKYGDLVRADITTTYRPEPDVFGFETIDPTALQSFSGELSTTVALVNGYVDLPVELAGVRPYVGGGVGVAVNTLGSVKVVSNDSGATTFLSEKTNTSFAWRAAAGASFALTNSLIVDFGYSYVDAGRANSGRTLTGVASGSLDGPVEIDVRAHEMRFAIRFLLGSPGPATP